MLHCTVLLCEIQTGPLLKLCRSSGRLSDGLSTGVIVFMWTHFTSRMERNAASSIRVRSLFHPSPFGPWPSKEENGTMVVLAHLVLPAVALDSLTITSILFAVIGTLYLAYDLLGRQHGPLQWLTLLITGGFVSALVLGLVGTILYLLTERSFSLLFTLQSLVIGGLMGVFTVALVDLPKSKAKPPIVSGKGGVIGLALGLLFFFTVYFILQAGVLPALAMGVTCAALASLWPYLTWDPSPTRPPVFSGKGFVVGLSVGLLLWSAFFFFVCHDVVTSVLGSVPLALVSGGIISLWRYIHWEEETEP